MKKKLDEEYEKIDVLAEGSTDDVKQILLDEEKESLEKRSKVIEFLDDRKTFRDYNMIIADLLIKRLNLVEWNGWSYKVAPTKEGVVMEVYSPDKRIFRNAFKPVRDPVDLAAIDIFAARAQNTIDGFSSQNRGTGKSQERT